MAITKAHHTARKNSNINLDVLKRCTVFLTRKMALKLQANAILDTLYLFYKTCREEFGAAKTLVQLVNTFT